MAAFKKGDKVRLISGGPVMVVANTGNYAADMGLGPEDGVLCQWFADVKGVQQVQEKVFDAAVLEPDGSNAGAVAFRASRGPGGRAGY